MGSRPNIKWTYIAGFIDGDGSMMLQIKKRSDTKRGFRFMATICLYQDSRHEKPLHLIRDKIGIGYVTKRNDGISELRVNGFTSVHKILKEIEPSILFKRVQLHALKEACLILQKNVGMLTKDELHKVVDLMMVIQNENYKAHRKKTRKDVLTIVGLTP